MPLASFTTELDVPADDLWNLVQDFGNTSWMPEGTEVVLEGEGVGMVRVVMGAIREKLEACNPDARTIEYSIADEGVPVPVLGYRATMRVEPAGSGAKLTWSCEGSPKDGSTEDEARAAVEQLYAMMAGWIQDELKKD